MLRIGPSKRQDKISIHVDFKNTAASLLTIDTGTWTRTTPEAKIKQNNIT